MAWVIITQRYDEPHRSYHTLRHLEYIFRQFDFYVSYFPHMEQNTCDRNAFEFAVFFHDLIYYTEPPRSNHNEEESASLFEELFRNDLDAALVKTVSMLILATKNHSQESSNTVISLFLDLDLSILGGNRLEYQDYAMQIRYEYQAVPAPVYCTERARFLRNLLASGRPLFRCFQVRRDKEELAWSNILWECEILESGQLVLVDS
jgi:predicted metal-dependent HD superfamily phosphohydrolase